MKIPSFFVAGYSALHYQLKGINLCELIYCFL